MKVETHERVSGHDQVFFMLDGRTTPYGLATLLLLDGPAPAHDAILEHVGDRLPRLSRFRQRLSDPGGVGRVRWIDDEAFDLEFHVRRMTLPAPGDAEALKGVTSRLMEQHLDRFRPLWELWVIERGPGSSALLLKAHHAVVDGMAGVHDLEVLFGPQRAVPAGDNKQDSNPIDRLVKGATRSLAGWGSPLSTEGAPAMAARGLVEMVNASIHPVSTTPFNGAIGPNRSFEMVHSSLSRFKFIKEQLGGTINDAVVAAVTGGLRTWLIDKGISVDGMLLRALVPISLRPPDSEQVAGNRVSGMLAPLPVDEPDPLSRLSIIRSATHSSRARAQGVGNALLLELPTVIPAPIARRIVDAQRIQRFFNLSLTNMRGPQDHLEVAGRKVTNVVPIPPLSANAGLIVAVMSYAGAFDFGLLADPALVPDLHLFAEAIDDSITELEHLAEAAL